MCEQSPGEGSKSDSTSPGLSCSRLNAKRFRSQPLFYDTSSQDDEDQRSEDYIDGGYRDKHPSDGADLISEGDVDGVSKAAFLSDANISPISVIYDKDIDQEAVILPSVGSSISTSPYPSTPEVHYVSHGYTSGDEDGSDNYVSAAESVDNNGSFSSKCYTSTPSGQSRQRCKDDVMDDLAAEAQSALCAERLTQMTKTYNDIEAVTRLLEEKERDLELAARIGQTLLEKNKKLLADKEELEEQLYEATEKVKQLKHEISMKDAIIQVCVQDYDCSPTPGTPREQFSLDKGILSVEMLQKKVKSLENENANLRLEASTLADETDNLEYREQSLVDDAVQQLAEVNNSISELRLEVNEKTEQNTKQQQEIGRLSDIGQKINQKNKQLSDENVELQSLLVSAQQAQHQLSLELSEMNERHEEILELFHETSAEARDLRLCQSSEMSTGMPHYYTPLAGDLHLPEGSLAHELSDSLRRDGGVEGWSPRRRSYNCRVMDTARCVRQTSIASSSRAGGSSRATSSINGRSIDDMSLGTSMLDSDDLDSCLSDRGYHADCDSVYSGAPSMSGLRLGRPGIPGSTDLQAALRRLSARKPSPDQTTTLDHLEDQRNANTTSGIVTTPSNIPSVSPSVGSDSMMSCDSYGSSGIRSAFPGLNLRLPEKLQIVKPMEGSMTLHHWQRLATPHMGGLLDIRPGVKSKGTSKEADQMVKDSRNTNRSSIAPNDSTDIRYYNINDIEEDDDEYYLSHIPTAGTNTFTSANVLHPGENYSREGCLSRSSSLGSIPALASSSMDSTPSSINSTTSGSSGFSVGIGETLRRRGLLTRLMMPSKKHKKSPKSSVKTSPLVSSAIESLSPSSYTTPSPIVPLEGISDTAEPMVVGNSFRLVERVQKLGVSNMITTCAAELPALATGLNSILGSRSAKTKTAPSNRMIDQRKNPKVPQSRRRVSLSSTESGIGSRHELIDPGLPRMIDYAPVKKSRSLGETDSPRKQSAPALLTSRSSIYNTSNVLTNSKTRHFSSASTSSGTASDATIKSPDCTPKHTTKCSSFDGGYSNTELPCTPHNSQTDTSDDIQSITRRARRPTDLRLPLTVEAQLYSKKNCMDIFDNEQPSTSKATQDKCQVSVAKQKSSVLTSGPSPNLLKHLSRLHIGDRPPSTGIAALMAKSQSGSVTDGVVTAPSGANTKKPSTSKSSLANLL